MAEETLLITIGAEGMSGFNPSIHSPKEDRPDIWLIAFYCPDQRIQKFPAYMRLVPTWFKNKYPPGQSAMVVMTPDANKKTYWTWLREAELSNQVNEEINESQEEQENPSLTPSPTLPKSNEHFDSLDLPPLITNADRYNGVNERYTQWKMDGRTAFMQAAGRSDIPVDDIEYWTTKWFRVLRNIGPLALEQELAEVEAAEQPEEEGEHDTSTTPSS